MNEFESLQPKLNIQLTYLYLRYAMDTRNAASLDESNKLIAEATRAIGFFLVRIDGAQGLCFRHRIGAPLQTVYAGAAAGGASRFTEAVID